MKKFLWLIAFLIPFFLMLYFGKETFYIENELAADDPYNYHFVLITEEVGNDYWRLIEKGAKEAAAEHDIYLEYIGPKVTDNEERLATFDRMITAGVDGIITKGMNDPEFAELVRKAASRNIPVATIDTDNEQSGREFYVGTDNYRAGLLAGKTLIEQTTGEQRVAVIIGLATAQNQLERLNGFEDAIAESDRIELVDVAESNITELGAAQATYQLLKKHSNITAFFGTSALDGIGIVQGIEEMRPRERPYVIAFDILPETLTEIEQGTIQATVAQYPEKMGRRSVELMLEIYNKKTVDSIHFTDTGIVDASHIHNGELIVPVEEGEQP
ncbi:sugar ABC transporter [Gracilibacillus boraciitolerans JCM 21714]|uniref:Sugar ABC transporter n=1 Tax=Gracilibacillus boraciitolerans JCM 21714 TaxID=1298598 RepID=W4VP33_9BACI|nr:sugar-binding protein [Gracilibacillus boraciitolerans]GAE95150.1 sugar ABC transporter [Gracilibacillus boraciitolerans JCM 21714]